MFSKFWEFLEKNKTLHSGLTALLFITQLAHLYWLFTHVVLFKLTGTSFFDPSPTVNTLLALSDFTEIPALITGSFFYANKLRKDPNHKNLLFLILLNSQWLHLLWITDAVILEQLQGQAPVSLPIWLSWFAIAVDYFELPVIIDSIKEFFASFKKHERNNS